MRDDAAAEASKRFGRRVLWLAAPFAVLPLATALYTYLNASQRLFVGKLGCGCKPFFNTNHLSMVVSGFLVGSAAISWWFGTRQLSLAWRLPLAGIFAIVALLFVRAFLALNFWL